MDPTRSEPHCIIERIIIRRGPKGLPASHREIDACQERHADWFVQNGWRVAFRDSDVMPPPIEPSQSNVNRSGDTGED